MVKKIILLVYRKITGKKGTAFVEALPFYRFRKYLPLTHPRLQSSRQTQRRREPNVGPGPAQIRRISGFVNSKTDREHAAFLSEL